MQYATNEKLGCCYESRYLSIWMIGPEGGTLSFKGVGYIQLVIPAGAITYPRQLVYMYLHKPPPGCIESSSKISFSPVVNCGPDGLKLKVRDASRLNN